MSDFGKRTLASKGQGWRPEGPRSGVGLFRRGSQLPPHQLWDVGERCKLPYSGSGADRAPAAKGFSRILNTQDGLSGQQDDGSQIFYFFSILATWPSGIGPEVGPEVGPERKW